MRHLSEAKPLFAFPTFLAILALALVLTGCSAKQTPVTLMETPIIYHDGAVDPFAHMDERHRSAKTSIFYATNRYPAASADGSPYGNGLSRTLRLGRVTIGMGGSENPWERLYRASISPSRPAPVELTLEETVEMASVAPADYLWDRDVLTPEQRSFARAVEDELDMSKDREIMVYVHGAKLDFFKACALTAELDHFAGRDFVGLAFSWPSHQNILTYVLGVDVMRARQSTTALRTLISFLSQHTSAERINIICYSAGGRLVSRALSEMRLRHGDMKAEALRNAYRLGTVVFAAADVPVEEFLDRLPGISAMAERVVVTVSDADDVLEAAEKVMGGGARIGTETAEVELEAFALSETLTNLEIVDLSRGREHRGFDITGHHYWYRHPWASSDIIFLLRTNLPGHRRGLTPAGAERVWYLGPDYPERARSSVRRELKGQW